MCDKLSPQGDSPDRWSRLTDKLEEAEQENARLREGIKRLESWRGLILWTHHQEQFDKELAALLAQPEGDR